LVYNIQALLMDASLFETIVLDVYIFYRNGERKNFLPSKTYSSSRSRVKPRKKSTY
jgi:hypothetical protein